MLYFLRKLSFVLKLKKGPNTIITDSHLIILLPVMFEYIFMLKVIAIYFVMGNDYELFSNKIED